MNRAKMEGAIVGSLYLPLAFFLTYLILSHIEATELMWFVWIITIPLTIVLQILVNVAKEDK